MFHRRNLPGYGVPHPYHLHNPLSMEGMRLNESSAIRRVQEGALADKMGTPKSGGGWNRSASFCSLLECPLNPNFSPLKLLWQLEKG